MAIIIVGGVLEKDGKYLLVQEKQERCYGKWNLPAGHLDPNETIFDGAIREVLEETGFTTNLTGIIGIFNRKLVDDVFACVIFSTEIIDGEINFDKDELLDVKWFSYDEIMSMQSELRSDFILKAITRHKENNITSLQLIEMIDIS